MKKLLFVTLSIFISWFQGFTQQGFGETPIIWQTFTQKTGTFIQPFNHQVNFEALDIQDKNNNWNYRIGVAVKVNQSVLDQPFEIAHQNMAVFEKSFYIPNAQALGLYFSKFKIPSGGRVFVFNPEKTQLLGYFDNRNNLSGNHFSIEPIIGDQIIITAEIPINELQNCSIVISEIGLFYRGFEREKAKLAKRDFGDSQNCQVNVNCSEGNSWKAQRDAVVRILVKDGSNFFWCTGALVNTTNGSCKPYILSADHCAATSSSTDFNQFIFYFNYESINCSNPISEGSLASKTITGCTKKSSSGTSGNDGSDFLLIELNDSIPISYKPFFAGWRTIDDIDYFNGVSIHHPNGDIKKISTYNSKLATDTWGGLTPNTHWRVVWTSTDNGFGVTEAGSSGSPIFNQQGLIVGTLTGGSSVCNSGTPVDFYGKFSFHWKQNGTTADKRLDTWLDPTNTGYQIIEGNYKPCKAANNLPAINANKQIIKLIPNPNSGSFSVIGDLSFPATAQIFDLTGKLLSEFKMEEQNRYITTQLKSGFYLLKITDTEKTIKSSFVIY